MKDKIKLRRLCYYLLVIISIQFSYGLDTVASSPVDNSERFEKAYQSCKELYQKGDYSNAIASINDMLDLTEERNEIDWQLKFKSLKAWVLHYNSELEKCEKEIKTIFELLEKNDIQKESGFLFDLYRLLSITYAKQNKYALSLKYTLMGIEVHKDSFENEYTREYINMFCTAGYTYIETKNYVEAFPLLEKAIQLSKKFGSNYNLAKAYHTMAILYSDRKQFDKALEYHLLVDNILENINEPRLMLIAKHNKGVTYFYLGEHAKARDLIKEAMTSFLEINNQVSLIESYLFLGKIDKETGNFTGSKTNLETALSLSKKTNSIDNVIKISLELCELFMVRQQYNEAFLQLDAISDYIEKSENPELLKQVYEFYFILNTKLGKNDKALNYFERYKVLTDSLYDVTRLNQIEILKANFDFENMQASLKQKDTELKLAKTSRQSSNLLISLLALGIIFLLVFTSYYIHKQKKLSEAKHKILDTQKELAKLKSKQLGDEVKLRKKQITDFAIHIKEKNDLLEAIKAQLRKIKSSKILDPASLNKVILFINDDINRNKEKVQLYSQIDDNADSFYIRLSGLFPDFTEKEKRIAVLIRLGLSSKAIGDQLNITTASVDNCRSLMRKKMKIDKGESLSRVIKRL